MAELHGGPVMADEEVVRSEEEPHLRSPDVIGILDDFSDALEPIA